jgi:uncharacterized protein (DUF2132 family)
MGLNIIYVDMDNKKHNILDGVTLKSILEQLVLSYGFEELGSRINIKCFTTDPSISSSLKFLRKTPWAREKVEKLYVTLKKK